MKKTQVGWVVLIIVALVEVTLLLQRPDSTTLYLVSTLMAAMVLLTGTLTITVTDTHLQFYFGIGLIRGKYALQDIVYCRPISYFSLGWGIRFKPGVTIFNVSGNKAIEIKRRSSSQIIYLGTDTPEEIVTCVYEKIKNLPINK
jgi:hypothetical protein